MNREEAFAFYLEAIEKRAEEILSEQKIRAKKELNKFHAQKLQELNEVIDDRINELQALKQKINGLLALAEAGN